MIFYGVFLILSLAVSVQGVQLGEICSEQTFCEPIPQAYCTAQPSSRIRRCACFGTHVQVSPQACAARAYQVGGSCAESPAQCDSLMNTACNSTSLTCECAEPSMELIIGRCLPTVELLGQVCVEDQQCKVEHSLCLYVDYTRTRRNCQCDWQTDHVQSELENKCVPKANVGASCEEDVQCRVKEQFAECRDGYLEDTIGRCLPPAFLGESCIGAICVDASGSAQFTTCDYGESSLGQCTCFDWAARELGEVCYPELPDVFGNTTCTEDAQCQANFPGAKVCNSDGACSCDAGYVLVTTSSYETGSPPGCYPESVGYGGDCVRDSQCTNAPGKGEGQICAAGRCVCEEGLAGGMYKLNSRGYCEWEKT